MRYSIRALFILAVIFAGFLFNAAETENDKTNEQKNTHYLRSARNITLQKMNLQKKTWTFMHAGHIVEGMPDKYTAKDFRLEYADKLNMLADSAIYDKTLSRLDVRDNIVIETKDGSRGYFKSLVWDKQTHMVRTDEPVHLELKEGILDAGGIEMLDDLSSITLIGGVNAEVGTHYIIQH